MRACFLGQNVCALGFGVAMVQSLPVEQAHEPGNQPWEAQIGPPTSAGRKPQPKPHGTRAAAPDNAPFLKPGPKLGMNLAVHAAMAPQGRKAGDFPLF